VAPNEYRTAKKSRILSGGENTKKQQVLRIDTLNRHRITEGDYQRLETQLTTLMDRDDVLIISDYIFESVRPELFTRLREKFPSVTVIIDSRYHLPRFPGVTYATPNEPEIRRIFSNRQFTEYSDYAEAGTELLDRLAASGIVLKRGKNGMIVFENGKEPRTIDIHGGSDIVDVTGAGDTVIAVVGLAVSVGADLFTAARLANVAAGMAVMKEGAYPIARSDLEAALASL
jgi:D-beta-D-heptose 7-phosphate kinase/D-beta-D-heptose 1-phosphate adenosyltransferase